MSALLENTFEGPQLDIYEFRQMTPVSSYAVIIAVGSLEKKKLIYRTNVFAENKYIKKCFKTFRSHIIESMLQIAESLCGPYAWGRYDVCVLPPSIAYFEIECPCVAFISPALLGGDSTSFTSLARNISQSWAGNLVTCSNYEHLWLNKSFNIFISRKIENKILIDEDMKPSLERKGLNDVNNMVEKKFENDDLLKCLIPNLTSLSLHEATLYVPYETVCMLLGYLENTLGPSVLEPFLKSYFSKKIAKID
ncbi:leukotriene A-4 hydrolase-like [Temnothorax nylanderi]|uniref:leukotriene A-4 hydrolase-like n=1 Tax=Temnothorax nylanderi TaxID=102681 RepID=UPI003A892133